MAHDNIIQLKSLAERNGRGLLEPALGALVQGVRDKRLVGWLVDGGDNNKLDTMRVPDTLIWVAFLIQKVRETTSVSSKTVPQCVFVG